MTPSLLIFIEMLQKSYEGAGHQPNSNNIYSFSLFGSEVDKMAIDNRCVIQMNI